jgi:protein-L-isoaspartate(D-aspartate) O-methyltransferase
LDQLAPDGRIVVPLDLRGAPYSVAFERAGGHWASRSVEPCGFMRMRGTLAGPEQVRVLDKETRLVLAIPEVREIDDDAVRAMLAGPAVELPTGVVADAPALYDGLHLWLAVREPRCCQLSEDVSAPDPRLAPAPLQVQTLRITVAVVDADGIAMLGRLSGAGLSAIGHGPAGARVAGDLVGHVRSWDAAGRPDSSGLRIAAYPGPAVPEPAVPEPAVLGPADGDTVIDKVHTRLAVTWSAAAN